MTAIEQLIDALVMPHSQMLLISGDAGIGKSRLVGEAKTYAHAHGAIVLQGACFPQDQTCPFAPLLDLVRANFADSISDLAAFAPELSTLLPDLLPATNALPTLVIDSEQHKRRLFAALARLILKERRQVVGVCCTPLIDKLANQWNCIVTIAENHQAISTWKVQ